MKKTSSHQISEIFRLRSSGSSIRAIQKQLGISTPSLVKHYLDRDKTIKKEMVRRFVFPEKLPTTKYDSCLLSAGYNAYRSQVLSEISKLAYPGLTGTELEEHDY